MSRRTKLFVRGHVLLAAFGAVTGLCLLIEMSGLPRIGFADYGAAIGSLAAFFVVPFGLATLALVQLGNPERISARQRWFVWGTRLGLVPIWLFSLLPAALWIAAVQPWPFSLNQGPDTSFARDGFRRLIGVAPPGSVRDVYYRQEGGFGDTYDKLRFSVDDPQFVESLIERKELVPLESCFELGKQGKPWWWTVATPLACETYGSPEPNPLLERLWFARAEGLVFYRFFSP